MTPQPVVVTVEIEAPIARVWRAITDPAQVPAWDGAAPHDVPTGYPEPGQHARWRIPVFGLPVTLHDRVREVKPPGCLAADLAYGIVRITERYDLTSLPGGRTRISSSNAVRSVVPGLGAVVARRVEHHVEAAMARLRTHCETGQEH